MADKKIKDQKSKIKTETKSLKPKAKVQGSETSAKAAVKAPKKEKAEAMVKTVAKPVKKAGMAVDVYNTKGKVVKTIDLPKEIFGAKVNSQLVSQAVRVYLANQRSGTASTKSRGEVAGSTRKIYKQKGTGRARHGSLRAPIFVHGGIAFGPKPHDFSLKLPSKMKKVALFSVLSAKLKDGEIKVIAELEKISPKTKSMVEVINNLELNSKKKSILLVLPSKLENLKRAVGNIEGVEMILVNQLNAYKVLQSRILLFMEEAITKLKIES